MSIINDALDRVSRDEFTRIETRAYSALESNISDLIIRRKDIDSQIAEHYTAIAAARGRLADLEEYLSLKQKEAERKFRMMVGAARSQCLDYLREQRERLGLSGK